MYGLPEDFDASFRPGRRLDQVCIGEYQTQLSFDGRVSISLESEFTLDGQKRTPGDGHAMHVVLGLQIREARREGRGDLSLDFGTHLLVVHESNDNYESYTIWNGECPDSCLRTLQEPWNAANLPLGELA